MPRYKMQITFHNGSESVRTFESFREAREYYRHGISYTGPHVRRVEVILNPGPYQSIRAIWDSVWDAQSQYAGLN